MPILFFIIQSHLASLLTIIMRFLFTIYEYFLPPPPLNLEDQIGRTGVIMMNLETSFNYHWNSIGAKDFLMMHPRLHLTFHLWPNSKYLGNILEMFGKVAVYREFY